MTAAAAAGGADAASLRAQIPLLAGGMHYLDNAATSLVPQSVMDAAAAYDARARANVGRGVYAWAEAADEAYEGARRVVAEAMGARPAEIVFCGGATAALNMLAVSLGSSWGPDDALWMAADNHHSNIVPWRLAASRHGFAAHFLPAQESGSPDWAVAKRMLASGKERPRALAVSHASNVTGHVMDLQEAATVARDLGALLIVDGAQHAPHRIEGAAQAGADFYAFSGHKCYAPNGVGVLWGREDLLNDMTPGFGGGGMAGASEDGGEFLRAPHRWEAGTPPISQAVALAAAVKWMRPLQGAASRARAMGLVEALRESLAAMPGVSLLGAGRSGGAESEEAHAPIVSFVAEGAHPHDICQILAAENVAARGGHHCARPLMRHLGISGCVRFSIAPYNDESDIRAALSAVSKALGILR